MTDDAANEIEVEPRIEPMKPQIDEGRLNIDKIRREMRWGPYKAIAAIVGTSAPTWAATPALAA